MGEWRPELTEKALKDLEDVPAKDRDRIKARRQRFAAEGPADLKAPGKHEGINLLLHVDKLGRALFRRDQAAVRSCVNLA